MYAISLSRLFFNANAVCPETVTACEVRRSSSSRAPGLGGFLNQQCSIATLFNFVVSICDFFCISVEELTAALKLWTSTVCFGPLGAGKGVLAVAIRTLSENVRDGHVHIVNESLTSLLRDLETPC